MPSQDAQTGRSVPGATHTFDQLAVQHDPLLGQIVGNYHLLAFAGEGTSGRVYRARDVRLDRTVALKLLHPGASRDRFEQEARALARLGIQAGVVDVYTWGEHEGRCYLALEYLPESVASLLVRRPGGVDIDTTLYVGIQCAEALAAAHRAGLLHGDIKPSNILLGNDGTVAKLCDFGLSTLSINALLQGGSPAYLAPECAAGGKPSAASDIYALGATLYTMLCGTPPVLEGDATATVRAAAAGRVRPLAAARPNLPAPVVDVITKALAPDPARRYATAEAFANALRELSEDTMPVIVQARFPRAFMRAAGLAAAVALAAIVVLAGQTFLPGNGGGTVVLADARLNLDQGKYADARKGFENYLNQQPENAEARYGLAYAFLLEGDQEHAAQEFARLGEARMQKEGKAAVAYMASGEAARPALEQAATDEPGGYAAVLLAMLDMMAGKFEAAHTRLDQVKESELKFDWQRRQYLQTLGQIYYKSGKFSEAEAVFSRLEQSSPGAPSGVAADYVQLSRERAATQEQKDFGDQIARIKDLLKSAPPAADTDTWTSRPLRIWIPPVEAGQGLLMQSSGLADILPWRLSRALMESQDFPITPVERAAEGAILAEQQLSASLSNPEEAVRLGRVLGARLLLNTKVTRLFNEELLHVSLVDTETTRWLPVGEYKVTRDLDVAAWLGQIKADLVAAAQQAYPVRGRITANGDRLVLNIGAAVGVAPGMRLHVVPGMDKQPLQGVEAVVAEALDEKTSRVELHGVPATSVPAEGWPVEQIAAAKGTANAS